MLLTSWSNNLVDMSKAFTEQEKQKPFITEGTL